MIVLYLPKKVHWIQTSNILSHSSLLFCLFDIFVAQLSVCYAPYLFLSNKIYVVLFIYWASRTNKQKVFHFSIESWNQLQTCNWLFTFKPEVQRINVSLQLSRRYTDNVFEKYLKKKCHFAIKLTLIKFVINSDVHLCS